MPHSGSEGRLVTQPRAHEDPAAHRQGVDHTVPGPARPRGGTDEVHHPVTVFVTEERLQLGNVHVPLGRLQRVTYLLVGVAAAAATAALAGALCGRAQRVHFHPRPRVCKPRGHPFLPSGRCASLSRLVHNERGMKDCCVVTADVSAQQRRVLQIVLWINAVMFLTECGAGLLAGSAALLGDSMDMLGDALVYGFSLHVVSRGSVWQARAGLLKGTAMAALGLGVLAEAVLNVARGIVPAADLMGGIGLLALAANALCLVLLWRRRADDINMRSAWLCSRNDVMANAGVLIAAGAVSLTGSAWPDITVGLLIAAMFVRSAAGVVKEARRALRPLRIP